MTLSLPLYLIINVLIKKIMSQKIRIKLKSYDHNLVDKSAEKIVRTVKATGAIVSGPIPLDRKSTRLNSSHTQKSRMPSSA